MLHQHFTHARPFEGHAPEQHLVKHHADRIDVIYRQGKNISVSSGVADIQTEIDGDPGPALPVEISVIRHAVNCVVPENAKPAGMRTRIVRAIG